MKITATFVTLTILSATTAAGGIASSGPNPEAAEEVEQFGQFVGSWRCTGENLQQDGTWKETPGVSTWDWYYVLDGYAVQDVWRPDTEANPKAAQGTNLRTFDAESGTWNVVWTTQKTPALEAFRASSRDGEIHMFAERPGNQLFRNHLMHITFFNISGDHFDWRYESSDPTDGRNWREVARLTCDRAGDDGSTPASGVGEPTGANANQPGSTRSSKRPALS